MVGGWGILRRSKMNPDYAKGVVTGILIGFVIGVMGVAIMNCMGYTFGLG